MSWFSDYVGKAESLLNALDSSAGDIFSNSFVSDSESSTGVDASNDLSHNASSNVSSSSYLSQQSPLPSFTAKRPSIPSLESSNGQSSLRYGNSPTPSPQPAKPALASMSRGSSHATASLVSTTTTPPTSVNPSPKTTSSTSMAERHSSSYSLDSSRLSQQLLRGSTGVDSALSSASSISPSSSSSAKQPTPSKLHPVISTSSSVSSASSKPRTDEEALLNFLNAPSQTSTPSLSSAAKVEEKTSESSSSSPPPPRTTATATATTIAATTTVQRTTECKLSVVQDDEKGDDDDPVQGFDDQSDAFTIPPEDVVGDHLSLFTDAPETVSVGKSSTSETEILDPKKPPITEKEGMDFCSPSLDAGTLPDPTTDHSAATTAASTATASLTASSVVEIDENESRDDILKEPPYVQIPAAETFALSFSTSSSIVVESPLPPTAGALLSTEAPLPPEQTVSHSEEESSPRPPTPEIFNASPPPEVEEEEEEELNKSSNGSCRSSTSNDANLALDADLSDAMKDSPTSPTSPYEESEPEMSTSDGRSPSRQQQEESEPEMIPTPPFGAAMTSSQESSSTSQGRFSDCEIFTAKEIADSKEESEDDDVGEPLRVETEQLLQQQQRKPTSASKTSVEGVTPPWPEGDDIVVEESSSTSFSLSKLQLENQLLRSEIHSLNEEMQGAWRQAQIAKEERARVARALEVAERRAEESEERARESIEAKERERRKWVEETETRAREQERRLRESTSLYADAQTALEAKDSQLAVMRVRLEEADSLQAELNRKCRAMEEENRYIVRERETAISTHVTAFETLKVHADRLQGQMDLKTEEGDRLRGDLMALEKSSSEVQEGLGAMVTMLQSELATEKARSVKMEHQANGGQRALEAAKKELEEYVAKATRTLQSKDRVIASLKEGSSDPTSTGASSASLLELDDVKSERDLLRQELALVQSELESCRLELADAEAQAAADREGFDDHLESLTKELKEAKDRVEATEIDAATLRQELTCAHDELHRAKIGFQEETRSKEDETQLLTRQLEAQTAATSPDLEARLHALAENLIEKQTMIESLTTERTSLKLQLERMSTTSPTGTAMGYSRGQTSVHISVDGDRPDHRNNNNGARIRLPHFLRETPQDTGVTLGVKRAAYTLDTLGIKIGVFFRRYPIARAFALVYAFVLHLWVFVVLLTYSPEIH